MTTSSTVLGKRPRKPMDTSYHGPGASTQHFERVKQKQLARISAQADGAHAGDSTLSSTPRSRLQTKGILHQKEYLPMKSSKWGKMRDSIIVDLQAQDDGFQGDGKLSFVSPLTQMTKDSNLKATRLQDVFTQKLKSCPFPALPPSFALCFPSAHACRSTPRLLCPFLILTDPARRTPGQSMNIALMQPRCRASGFAAFTRASPDHAAATQPCRRAC